jgi:hypothetical protein
MGIFGIDMGLWLILHKAKASEATHRNKNVNHFNVHFRILSH